MPQGDDPRHNLRLTPALKTRLAHAAIDSGRSMNAEILARLEHSFAPDPAAQIAEVLRPLAGLNDAQRHKVAELLTAAGIIMAAALTTATDKK
ncbi:MULTISPECIES: Arc family DNA-binding protein [Mesorhizobium]|uniref:Arc family DNA-binding protein n=1 Tax=Mesorhizobium TaxID=68287 RepID=UPI0010A9583D|nr:MULTISPECIES: Arc family DNA-binding protein [Mesorhizobium]